MSTRVLIIDDEEALGKLLARIISLEGFITDLARSLKEARQLLKLHLPDIVLCDVKLPDGNGVEFVRELKHAYPQTMCILLTAFGNIPDGVQAIKNGAFDYITKGDDNDRIIPLLYQAEGQLKENRKRSSSVSEKGKYQFKDIIGTSPAILEAISLAKKVADTETNVLLTGETGTGKEVFAGAIHSASRRADKPFVALNCSAFSRELLEGELFGYKAGAYTGATKDKKGLIETADHGTLFLDEIGEMPIELQAKLLRVLENGEFFKLGFEKPTKADVRIIAATNRTLETEIKAGHFREDLFYRLNGFSIELPPLRDRTQDIPSLVTHFLTMYAKKENRSVPSPTAAAMKLLQSHSWKGNIRELKNVLERAVILAGSQEFIPADLPYEIQQGKTGASGLSLAEVEKAHIQKVLRHTAGNKTKTAELLGIGLTTLYRKIDEYHLG